MRLGSHRVRRVGIRDARLDGQIHDGRDRHVRVRSRVQLAERHAVRVPADGVCGAQHVRVVGVVQSGPGVLPETVQGAETAHVPVRSATVLHGHRQADHRLPERQPSAPERLHTAAARDEEPEAAGKRGKRR